MAEAKRDENFVTTIIAALESDGTTVVPVKADPTTNALSIESGGVSSDHGNVATRDQNYVTAIMAVSSDDGETPVPLYADANGNLLVDIAT